MKKTAQTCFTAVPENYTKLCSIDLVKDEKAAWTVNGLCIAIFAAMLIPMHFYMPITTLVDGLPIKLLALGGATVLYMVLHEAVHGIAMKHYGADRVKFGFTGGCAYAGCDGYFAKKPYIVIALAPIVVWGVVLAVLNILVPAEWFWVVYFIQALNVSGAAGDLYVSCKFSRMPADILVRDSGVAMEIYSAQK